MKRTTLKKGDDYFKHRVLNLNSAIWKYEDLKGHLEWREKNKIDINEIANYLLYKLERNVNNIDLKDFNEEVKRTISELDNKLKEVIKREMVSLDKQISDYSITYTHEEDNT